MSFEPASASYKVKHVWGWTKLNKRKSILRILENFSWVGTDSHKGMKMVDLRLSINDKIT